MDPHQKMKEMDRQLEIVRPKQDGLFGSKCKFEHRSDHPHPVPLDRSKSRSRALACVSASNLHPDVQDFHESLPGLLEEHSQPFKDQFDELGSKLGARQDRLESQLEELAASILAVAAHLGVNNGLH